MDEEGMANVTFLLNDGGYGAYLMHSVEKGERVDEPETPEREHYAFSGWYEEPQAVNEYDFSEPVMGDVMLYAGWSNPDGDDSGVYGAATGTETVYSITGMEIEDDQAIVTINANSKCILVLNFLDEETEEVLESIGANTPDYCEMTNIVIPIDDIDLPEYFLVEEFEIGVSVSASVDNSEEVKDELEAAKIIIPTGIPTLTVYTAVTVPTEWEIKGEGTLKYTTKIKTGFKYDSNSGYQPVDKKESKLNLSLEGSAKISIGPKAELGIQWGVIKPDMVSANVSVQAGAEVSATLKTPFDFEITDADSIHACYKCIEGEANWFVEAKAKLKLEITERLSYTAIDATLCRFEGELRLSPFTPPNKFYISTSNSADSCFEGIFHFGFGDCPNVTYRTLFIVKDADGNEISAEVTILKQNGNRVAKCDSSDAEYLYDGTYIARVNFDGDVVNKSFVVNGDTQTVIIKPDSKNGTLIGKVIDADTNEAIEGATVLIKQGNMTMASFSTDFDGGYSMTLADGTYIVEVSKDGYVPYTATTTIQNGNDKYIETSLMVGDSDEDGGFSGRIVNAVNGQPIEGVTLKLRAGWDNSSEGEVIKTLYTDSNGRFEYRLRDLMFVKVGLNPGNYTLTATKDGYATKSFNIVVLPGITKGDQNATLSPTMIDGNYRFILRWGVDPDDLDSHLVGPTGSGGTFHTWYADKTYGNIADLDLDDTTSYGPETTTIRRTAEGIYTFYVHHYSGISDIAHSGAYVEVYNGDVLLETFYAPTNGGSGIYWNVCTLNAMTGELVPGNTITNSPTITAQLSSVDDEEYESLDETLSMIDEKISSTPKE